MSDFEVFVPRPSTSDAINNIANHDLKAEAYIGLVVNGEATRGELARDVAARSGIVACKAFVMGYPPTFAKTGFATYDQYPVSTGQMAKHFIPLRENETLPVVGVVQEWGEIYDSSVIPFFSTTSHTHYGAINALGIIDGLLSGQRLQDIGLPGYKPYEQDRDKTFGYEDRIGSLVKNGLVVEEEDPNEFIINNPNYNDRFHSFESLTPESKAVYQVLKIAKELDADGKWTIGQLIELAEKFELISLPLVSKFRRRLVMAVSDKRPTDFPGAVHKRTLVPKRYRINEQRRDSLSDLVERVKKIDKPSDKELKSYRQYALDTYSDPQLLPKIVSRGIKHSLSADESTKQAA